MAAAFFVAVALVTYAWVGYPLLAFARARLAPRPWRAGSVAPTLTILIAARDEAAVLGEKLASVRAQRYPPGRVEVLVVDDGSRDDTAAIARRAGATVRALPLPLGKAAALAEGAARARGEVLVLTDARQPLDPDALEALVAPLADPRVGAVTGELRWDAAGGGGAGAARGYRRLDDRLRRWEALGAGSAIGATGALYAVRRRLFVAPAAGLLADDLAVAMAVVRAGRRVVVAPRARAREVRPDDEPRAELRRRVRTLAGNAQLLREQPWLLSPWANPAWLSFVSHKVARLAAAPALLVALATSAALADRPFFSTALGLQVAAYLLALAGWRARARPRGPVGRLARTAALLAGAHAAVLLGLLAVLRGREGALWRGVEADGDP